MDTSLARHDWHPCQKPVFVSKVMTDLRTDSINPYPAQSASTRYEAE